MAAEVNCDDYWQDGSGQWWVKAQPRPRPIPASQVPAECKTTRAMIVRGWASETIAIGVGKSAKTRPAAKEATKKKAAGKAKAKVKVKAKVGARTARKSRG